MLSIEINTLRQKLDGLGIERIYTLPALRQRFFNQRDGLGIEKMYTLTAIYLELR